MMKFQWKGTSGIKDLDLVLAGVKPAGYELKTNDVIEVPDDNIRLIKRIRLNANYEEYIEPKKPTGKKENKNKGGK